MKTRAFLALCWVVLLGVGNEQSLHAQSTEQDSLALVTFYNSTNGANWINNAGWLSSPLSQWHGVTVVAGRVTRLDLSINQVVGTLPAALGNLGQLKELRLDHNQLSGAIPPELGNLSRLSDLRLVSNQISGPIPSEIGNLTDLTDLRLNHNQLSGAIPPELGNLSSIKFILIASNQLSGSIPAELGNLSTLAGLSLESNQLTGNIPPELGNLASLTGLGLNHNLLTGSIPTQLGNLSMLEELSLASNQLSGPLPEEIGNLTNLRFMSLTGNPLAGTLPLNLVNLTNLSTFWFSDTNLCGPDDTTFQRWMRGIDDLKITGCTPVANEDDADIPFVFSLGQNYPNPFFAGTTIRYALPDRMEVRLEVYDVLGRRVDVLVNEMQSAGQYEVRFEAEKRPGGLYMYSLKAGDFLEVRQMHLLR